jgi:hypothetical protein
MKILTSFVLSALLWLGILFLAPAASAQNAAPAQNTTNLSLETKDQPNVPKKSDQQPPEKSQQQKPLKEEVNKYNVIDAPKVCPPGYKYAEGKCRKVY